MNICDHFERAIEERRNRVKVLRGGNGEMVSCLHSSYFLGNKLMYYPPYIMSSRPQKILALQADLQDRQTTNLADEPVCLTVMLELDVDVILKTAEDKRMECLWRLISQKFSPGASRPSILVQRHA